MNKGKSVSRSPHSPRRAVAGYSSPAALSALLKFRLIVNSAKRHYAWIEKQCGVSGVHIWALWHLSNQPNIRVTELAEIMAIHQSTASNLIERLAADGYLKRTRSESDRRLVTLTLTAQGRLLLARAPTPAQGILQDALHRMPTKKLRELDSILAYLLGEMDKVDVSSTTKPLADSLR